MAQWHWSFFVREAESPLPALKIVDIAHERNGLVVVKDRYQESGGALANFWMTARARKLNCISDLLRESLCLVFWNSIEKIFQDMWHQYH